MPGHDDSKYDADLADDPVTNDLVEEVEKLGIKVHWGEEQEGKRKPTS